MATTTLYGDPNLNPRRKPLPGEPVPPDSLTNTAPTGGGLHDPVNESLTGAPTNTGPMAPSGTSLPPPPAAPAQPYNWTPQEAAAAGLGWVDANNPNYGKPGFVGAQGPTAQPAAPGAPTTPTAPAEPGPIVPGSGGLTPGDTTQIGGQFKDALLKMLNDNQQEPTINDPALKGQADAYSLAQTRAKERARSALAERMAGEGGQGTSSGAFSNDLVGLEQQQGENEAGYNAGLVGTELQNRRNQLMAAATLAGNTLNAEEQRALQKQIADVDAAIRREGLKEQGRESDIDAELKRLGINTQAALGTEDNAIRRLATTGQLNLGLLQALMQNQQFGQSLGADLGKFNASQGNSYLNALLSQLGA